MEDQEKKQYLPLLLIAYIFAFYTTSVENGVPTDIVSITRFMGQGLGVAIIPLVVMRFAGNTAGSITLVVSCFGIYVQINDSFSAGAQKTDTMNTNPVIFHAKGCEYTVAFPSKPIVETYTNQEIGDYEEAIWVIRGPRESISLKSECLNIPNLNTMVGNNAKKFILDQLTIFATNNGLGSPEFKYKKLSIGEGGSLRGIKLVEGVPATYEIVMIMGENSIITMNAGGTSATYPQKVISPFLTSVKLYR